MPLTAKVADMAGIFCIVILKNVVLSKNKLND